MKNKVSPSAPEYRNTRVLYVGSPPLFSGGASSVHMMKMCQAMTRLGISVECVLPGRFSEKKLFDYYGVSETFGVTAVPFTDGPGRQFVHGLAASVYALRRKGSYDFALTRNLVFAWLCAGFFGIPTVYDAHHPPVNRIAEEMIRSFSRSGNLLGMSFNSKGLREIYSRLGIAPRNSVVAHNGVELEMFENPKDVAVREKLGIPPEKKIVCYCGNTYEGRGVELLADAAERFPDTEFLVVGGAERCIRPHREAARSRGLGNFTMTGLVPQSEVSSYLLASDILVLPYSSSMTIRGGTKAGEFTSPLKVFEYMAAGKPIVATEIPSVLEILEPGRNSVTVAPDNPKKFFDALSSLINDPDLCARISRNALSDVQQYTWKKRVEKIMTELEIACG